MPWYGENNGWSTTEYLNHIDSWNWGWISSSCPCDERSAQVKCKPYLIAIKIRNEVVSRSKDEEIYLFQRKRKTLGLHIVIFIFNLFPQSNS